ncbi:hypothetical protein IW256_003688 [Actinomadura viridis]|uniref:Uncharacterized protein n=1 Tax=Actinomadura viridis TaxID=58110 RepID=A0A931DGD0_9ACTN|nr:hypothetical protein [Actinomadura viridis]
MPDRGQQRRGLPPLLQIPQRGGLGRHPVPGQRRQLHRRHRLHLHPPGPDPGDLSDPVQLRISTRPDAFTGEVRSRSSSDTTPPVQPSVLGPAHLAHQPRQHRDARQQHPLLHQVHHRPVEQRPRALGRRPHPRRHKATQLGLPVGEVAVAQQLADLPRVLVHRLRTPPVLGELGRIDAELLSDEPHHPARNRRGLLGQEHPQHPHRAPLHRPAQPRRRPPPLVHLLQRDPVQPEELLQLGHRRLLREPAIAGDLCIREKFEGHGPGTYGPSPGQTRPVTEPKRRSASYR